MKIKVNYVPSSKFMDEEFTPEDLGLTIEDWKSLSDSDKRQVLMDNTVEQPYWQVDEFTEEEE